MSAQELLSLYLSRGEGPDQCNVWNPEACEGRNGAGPKRQMRAIACSYGMVFPGLMCYNIAL